MVTDQEISDYYSNNIKMLETIAAGISYKSGKNVNPSAAISESYLYITDIKHKIKSDDLQRYVIKYIRDMLYTWSNSQLNRKEGSKKLDMVVIPDIVDDVDDSIDSKIEIELWYNERKCILEMYRSQEKDKVKQIIFDCYFNKNIIKGTDMAKHLGINKDYACKYIRIMKKDIRQFYKNQPEYNNIKNNLWN